ncbi:MAG: hypothetical protein DRQ47_07470, partial [Gammaproteobacteria bacterium]
TANGIKVPSADVLLDRAAGANSTLKIYGKGLPDYGEGVFQDMLYMLENYAASTIPRYSIEGQVWYNNVGTGTGSPTSGPELFIRKTKTVGATEGLNIATDWDAIILASGSSAMTGELSLAGNPTDPTHAVPLLMLTTHTTDFDIHITPEQNTFLDGLDITGSPPNLTATEVNYLSTTTSDVQVQLDSKVSRTGDTMIVGSPPANITFVGGEVLGLPVVPSVDDAAASKKYVDDQNSVGTGELTAVAFVAAPAVGSPPIFVDTSLTTALFTVTSPSTTYNLQLDDISRAGHAHAADEIVLDNSFNGAYPTNLQGSTEYVDAEIENIKQELASITNPEVIITLNIERQFELLGSDILVGSPVTPYSVLSHIVDDNNLSITINGVKQYNHTHGYQDVVFYRNIGSQSLTHLDDTADYDFNINVDGAGATLITITSGTAVDLFGELLNAINNAMNVGSPPALDNVLASISDGKIAFITDSSGTGSTISITDPSTANDYLFDIDAAPLAINSATFVSDAVTVTGSPPGSPTPVPDTIEILGDVSSTFSVGTVFSIVGSFDTTYNVSFDGTYSVHVSGPTVGGSPLTTTIPIAVPESPNTNTPLIPAYVPGGSPTPPAPSPSTYGDTHITPIANIAYVDSAVAGLTGDYAETDAAGNTAVSGETTSHILFNYDILTGSRIETLKYT